MKKKIVFDNIIFSLQKSGGISVVWEELLKRVLNEKSIEPYFLDYMSGNICRSELNIPIEKIIKTDRKMFFLERYINPSVNLNGNFIFHSSYYRTVKCKSAINITTVHDFTYEHYLKGLKGNIHIWQKHKAIRNSDIIICISNNTKKDLLKFLPDVDESKIRVIYNGVSEDYFPISIDEELGTNLPFRSYEYVLFVGSRGNYKNFDLAVKSLAKSRYNLVIVGTPLAEKEKQLLETHVGNHRYIAVGHVSNHRLNELYNNAFTLLYPSAYEGFGIPVIEAQRATCPVIAYNGSSIPEIIGKTPLLFRELSTESILQCFTILENEKMRNDIIAKGLINSKRFSWNQTFNRILDIYNTFLN